MNNKIILNAFFPYIVFVLSFLPFFAHSAQFKKIMEDSPSNVAGTLLYHQGALYVSDCRQNLIYQVKGGTTTAIPVQSFPQGMVAKGNLLFVATTRGEFLTVINTSLKRVVREIDLQQAEGMIGPSGLALENQTLFVSDSGAQKILPIDFSTVNPPSFTLRTPYPTGPKLPNGENDPYNAYTVDLLTASEGKVFEIAVRNYLFPQLNIVRVLDSVSGQTLLEYKPWDQGEEGRYNAIHRHTDGTVFVSAPLMGSVLSINPHTLKVTRLQTGAHWPTALASVGKYLVVLDRGPTAGETFDPVANEKFKPGLEIMDPTHPENPILRRINLSDISNGEIIRPWELTSSPEGIIYVKSESLISEISGAVNLQRMLRNRE